MSANNAVWREDLYKQARMQQHPYETKEYFEGDDSAEREADDDLMDSGAKKRKTKKSVTDKKRYKWVDEVDKCGKLTGKKVKVEAAVSKKKHEASVNSYGVALKAINEEARRIRGPEPYEMTWKKAVSAASEKWDRVNKRIR